MNGSGITYEDVILAQSREEEEKLRKKLEEYENMRKEAYNTLTKSKEYVMALAMELNEKQSVLIQLANILNKVGGRDE